MYSLAIASLSLSQFSISLVYCSSNRNSKQQRSAVDCCASQTRQSALLDLHISACVWPIIMFQPPIFNEWLHYRCERHRWSWLSVIMCFWKINRRPRMCVHKCVCERESQKTDRAACACRHHTIYDNNVLSRTPLSFFCIDVHMYLYTYIHARITY